jgi:NAD+ kinase
MVLHENAIISLTLHSRHQACMSVDGRDNIALEEGDEVIVRRSNEVCIFARLEPPSQFYASLVRRLRREW